jgi:hypothetical protein
MLTAVCDKFKMLQKPVNGSMLQGMGATGFGRDIPSDLADPGTGRIGGQIKPPLSEKILKGAVINPGLGRNQGVMIDAFIMGDPAQEPAAPQGNDDPLAQRTTCGSGPTAPGRNRQPLVHGKTDGFLYVIKTRRKDHSKGAYFIDALVSGKFPECFIIR